MIISESELKSQWTRRVEWGVLQWSICVVLVPSFLQDGWGCFPWSGTLINVTVTWIVVMNRPNTTTCFIYMTWQGDRIELKKPRVKTILEHLEFARFFNKSSFPALFSNLFFTEKSAWKSYLNHPNIVFTLGDTHISWISSQWSISAWIVLNLPTYGARELNFSLGIHR